MEEDYWHIEQRRVDYLKTGPQQRDEGVVKTSMKMRLLIIFALSAGAIPCLVAAGVQGAVQKVFRFK